MRPTPGKYTAANADDEVWTKAINLLRSAIELDPAIKPKQWEPERIRQAVEYMAQ